MSKIFIGGDSWGCGEWTEQTVSHKGGEQYFINDNYTVFNSSEGGSSNKFSIDRLDKDLRDYYISGDIIIWIQTDPIRDLRVEEQGEYGNNIFVALKNNNNSFNQLEKYLLTASYDKLSNIANIYNATIHVIGGLRNIDFTALSKFKNLNMLVNSWVYLLINRYGDENHGFAASDWSIDNFLIDQLPNDTKLQLVNNLYEIHSRHQSISTFGIFRPDGQHPNRSGHKHLYNFIKEKLNL